MLLSEYRRQLRGSREQYITTPLADVDFTDEGIILPDVDHPIIMDAMSIEKVSELLGVRSTYLTRKCPTSLLIENLNFWKDELAHQVATFVILEDELQLAYDANKKIISEDKLLAVLEEALPSNTEVVTRAAGKNFQEINLTSEKYQTEIGEDTINGGIRMIYYPGQEEAPMIELFLNRVVSASGLTITEEDAKIRLRGFTVGEVLEDLENKTRYLVSVLDHRLSQYRDTAKVEVPGNPEAFIHRICQENKIGSRVENRLLDRASELSSDPSMYEVINLLTTTANDVRSSTQRYLLQSTAGTMVTETEWMTHRCSSCEQLLH